MPLRAPTMAGRATPEVSRRSKAVGVLAAVTLATCLPLADPARALPRKNDLWRSLETPSFTVYGNADPDTILQFAEQLESFRQVLPTLLGVRRGPAPLPTLVYLFKNTRSFRDYVPERPQGELQEDGWFVASRSASFLVVDVSSVAGTEVVLHEYVHSVVESAVPTIPLWLNEALADYYSTFRLRDDRLEVGRPVERHVRFLRDNALLPFEDLFAVTTESPLYSGAERSGIFYAQSWALLHYLTSLDEDRQPAVSDFLRRVRGGEAAETALQDTLDLSTEDLRRLLKGYVEHGTFRYAVMPFEAPQAPELGAVRMMGRAEALDRLGLLLLRLTPAKRGEAAEHFREALALDPGDARATAGLGELALDDEWLGEAIERLEAAVAADPGLVEAWDLLGLALLRSVRQTANGGPVSTDEERQSLLRSRQAFQRAIELDADFAPALAGLGSTYLNEGEPSEGLEPALRATELLPARGEILLSAMAVAARAGDLQVAQALHTRLNGPNVDASEEMLVLAEGILVEAEHEYLIRSLQGADRQEELLAGLRGLLVRATDEATRQHIEREVEDLERVVERNRWIDRYNQAVALVNGRRYRDALPLLRSIVEAPTAPEDIAGEARSLLAELHRRGVG